MKKFLAILFLGFSVEASAQLQNRFAKDIFISAGDTLPYRLYVAPSQKTTNPPLVLWLHGKGERGHDNVKQLGGALLSIADSVINGSYPAILLVPQCPADDYWSVYDKTKERMEQSTELTATEITLIALLNDVIKEHHADPSRIYIVGMSMGGFGVWDLVTRYPEKFAAAVPICGGGDPSKAGKLKHVPVWAFHGADDKVIRSSFTQEIMSELLNLQPQGMSKLTIYPGVGHNAWDYAVKEPGLLKWMFVQKKEK